MEHLDEPNLSTSSTPESKLPLIIGALFFLLIFAGGIYYIYQRSVKNNFSSTDQVNYTVIQPSSINKPTQFLTINNDNWETYKKGYIVYAVGNDLWIMDLEGNNHKIAEKINQINGHEVPIKISKDGTEIAWLSSSNAKDSDLTAFDLKTGKQTKLITSSIDNFRDFDYLGFTKNIVYIDNGINLFNRQDEQTIKIKDNPQKGQPTSFTYTGIMSFPDGKKLVAIRGVVESSYPEIIDITGKSLDIPRELGFNSELSLDGKYIYSIFGSPFFGSNFKIYDINTKKYTDFSRLVKSNYLLQGIILPTEEIVYTTSESGIRCSKEGSTPKYIYTMNLDGSNLKEIYQANPMQNIELIGWSKDKNNIFFTQSDCSQKGSQILRLNLSNNYQKTVLLNNTNEEITSFKFFE